MDTVNFLAQAWGFSLVIIALSLLTNQKHIQKMIGLMEDEARIILSGIVGTILGVILILTYNVWDASWQVVITILGWAVLAKGAIRLFFPEFVVSVLVKYKNKAEWMPFLFVAIIFLGCFLIYMGFSS